MSDLRGRAGQTGPRRVSDGQPVDLRTTRDGTPFTADWYTALALEGRCFTCNHGIDTTPVAVTGGYTAAKPDLYVIAPNNVVLIPLNLYIAVEDTLAASAVTDYIAVASGAATTGFAGTTLTIMNVRTDAPLTSGCTACGTVTGTATTPATGNFYEFWRPQGGAVINNATAAAGGFNYAYTWSALKASAPPVIVGDGSLSVYVSVAAQAQTVFMGATWAELPESSVI